MLDILPYKLTYTALLEENEETLSTLIINSTIRRQLIHFYQTRFEGLASKSEKKFAIRAFIYLDCLVTFYRMPNHIENSVDELTTRLKTIPQVIEHLLETFSQTSVVLGSASNGQLGRKVQSGEDSNNSSN